MVWDTFAAWLAARPVSAKRLHRCRLLDDRGGERSRQTSRDPGPGQDHDQAWRASVFPFFAGEGVVQALLCVRHDEPGLFVARHRDDLLKISPWLPRRVGFRREDWQELVAGERLAQLARLWHYDPWWVLTLPPFAEHLATPLLKATNCASRLPRSPKSFLFEPGLGRVHGLSVSEGDHEVKLPWKDDWLAQWSRPELPAAAMDRRRRWVLDPIWLRGGR